MRKKFIQKIFENEMLLNLNKNVSSTKSTDYFGNKASENSFNKFPQKSLFQFHLYSSSLSTFLFIQDKNLLHTLKTNGCSNYKFLSEFGNVFCLVNNFSIKVIGFSDDLEKKSEIYCEIIWISFSRLYMDFLCWKPIERFYF